VSSWKPSLKLGVRRIVSHSLVYLLPQTWPLIALNPPPPPSPPFSPSFPQTVLLLKPSAPPQLPCVLNAFAQPLRCTAVVLLGLGTDWFGTSTHTAAVLLSFILSSVLYTGAGVVSRNFSQVRSHVASNTGSNDLCHHFLQAYLTSQKDRRAPACQLQIYTLCFEFEHSVSLVQWQPNCGAAR